MDARALAAPGGPRPALRAGHRRGDLGAIGGRNDPCRLAEAHSVPSGGPEGRLNDPPSTPSVPKWVIRVPIRPFSVLVILVSGPRCLGWRQKDLPARIMRKFFLTSTHEATRMPMEIIESADKLRSEVVAKKSFNIS